VGNQQLTENLVYLNKVAYVSIGNEIGQIFPGKSWVSLDLSLEPPKNSGDLAS
jgi:hypothetical protein